MAQRITHQHHLLVWAVLSALSISEAVLHQVQAAELNTNVPTVSETGGFPVQINLPAQPLNQSIRQLANQTGLSISFDSELTKNKTAAYYRLKVPVNIPQSSHLKLFQKSHSIPL